MRLMSDAAFAARAAARIALGVAGLAALVWAVVTEAAGLGER
jgi:hypothetical protein